MSQDFKHINVDHSIFVNKTKKLIVIVYVDDLLIINFKDNNQILKLKKTLVDRFKITNLDSCYYYLNMKITRDRANKTLQLSQRIYVEKMLKRFELFDCKSNLTSMATSIYLIPKESH